VLASLLDSWPFGVSLRVLSRMSGSLPVNGDARLESIRIMYSCQVDTLGADMRIVVVPRIPPHGATCENY
jgi:hypothetical protein